jgi:hypothetical protein
LLRLVRLPLPDAPELRIASRDEFTSSESDLIDGLIAGALVVEDDSARTVRLAHESLLSWSLIKVLVEQNKEFLAWLAKVQTSVEAWDRFGHERSFLLKGSNLIEASDWVRRQTQDIRNLERDFIWTSERATQYEEEPYVYGVSLLRRMRWFISEFSGPWFRIALAVLGGLVTVIVAQLIVTMLLG